MGKKRINFTEFWARAGTVGLLGGLVGGGAWALSGGDLWQGIGWSLVASEGVIFIQELGGLTPSRNPRRQSTDFAAVAPGHAGVFRPAGTIYPRGSRFANWLADLRLKRNIEREQWRAEDRDVFAPSRRRTLVFYASGVQLRQPVVYNFLRLAERNRARGVGLSERYWTQRNRSDWWQPAYYAPMMTLLATAQRRSRIQLVIERGNWRFLALDKDYTFGVVRERCDAYWLRM